MKVYKMSPNLGDGSSPSFTNDVRVVHEMLEDWLERVLLDEVDGDDLKVTIEVTEMDRETFDNLPAV